MTSTSFISTLNPTVSPNTYIPTTSPTRYKRLHFFCRYRDDERSVLRHLSYTAYAKLMLQVLLDSIQIVFERNNNYDKVIPNELVPWRRGGIAYFIICNVFGISLQNDCPEYDDSASLDDDEFFGIGFFGIVADRRLSVYKERLLIIQQQPQ